MSRLEDEFNDTTPPGAAVLGFGGVGPRTILAWNVITEGSPIGLLESCDVYLRQSLTPGTSIGNIWMELATITGTLGVDAEPNVVLGTSGVVDVSTLVDAAVDPALVRFDWLGIEQVALDPGTDYMLVLNATGVSVSDIHIAQPGLDPGIKSIQRTSFFNLAWSPVVERAWWFEMRATDGVILGGPDGITGITDIVALS